MYVCEGEDHRSSCKFVKVKIMGVHASLLR